MQASTPTTPPAPGANVAEGARYAIAVLTAMNLLNYIDRYIPSAVKALFQRDLGLTDAQTSWPLTAFIVVYMLTSPMFGTLADRWPRRFLVAGGVVLWSLATAGAALATGFWSFLAARALVGVGEAAYATLAPAIISDFYPPERRNRALTMFFVAIPVGAALGFGIGGALGKLVGWRGAFLACGLPGVAAALLALRIRDPREHVATSETSTDAQVVGWRDAIPALLANRPFVCAVLGYTLVTFAVGGMADWLPTWLARERGNELVGMSSEAWAMLRRTDPAAFDARVQETLGRTGLLVGAVTVIGGLGGTLAGGWLGDRASRWTRNPYLAVSALTMIPGSILAAAALNVSHFWTVIALVGAAQFCMWCYNSPINTVIANSTDANLRAKAFSFSILCIHLLGDAISPPIIGAVSDATHDLTLALQAVPAMLLLGGLTWLVGWRRL